MTDQLPPLEVPSLQEQFTIVFLTDTINKALRPYPVDTVLSVVTNLVLGGYMGAPALVRQAMREDIALMVAALDAIGQERDPLEMRRRVMAAMPNSVFTRDCPAGTPLQ